MSERTSDPFDETRWLRLSPLLDECLALEGDERAAWLERLRSEDAALADDVASALARHAAVRSESFLDQPAARTPAGASLAGMVVGAYTLRAPLGQGGMGSVWLADRSDGRFSGRAAVKLLNVSLIGRAGEARFRREASILARLRHPHIAGLIDAGVSSLGQPYLVLEHVDGERIDRHCETLALDAAARVRLFLEVLEAVAHAHAHLIVHRDLKPHNVLVDREGRARLLDFGIARLMEPDPDEAATLTREGESALTPEYAAPEQVTGGLITTATDIYGLGVLLYVMLTGQHPSGSTNRTPAEWVRAIADTEPRPMSALGTAPGRAAGPGRAPGSAPSGSPGGVPRAALRGDLDNIAAKALRKDPRQRYASVEAFADDLRRWLDGKPVEAGRGGYRYRMSKFVRRHRVPVASAALAILALIAGVAGVLVQSGRARRAAAIASAQRDFALRQLSRAEAINDLNNFLLSDVGGRTFAVGDLLGQAENILDHGRGTTDPNRPEMLMAIGRQYQTLEETSKARRLLTEAYDLSRGTPDHDTAARAACALASTLATAGESDRAEGLIKEGLDQLPGGTPFVLSRVFCLLRGSEVARRAERADDAVTRVEEASRLLRGSGQGSALLTLRAEMDLAETYRQAGRLREADAAFATAWSSLEGMGRGGTESAGTLLNNWALVQRTLGRPLEAERNFRRAVDISGADTTTGVSPLLLNNLARTLMDLGRLDEARDDADRACALARSAGNEFTVTQSLFLRNLIDLRLGNLPRAASLAAELEPRVRVLPEKHPYHAVFTLQQAMLAHARGDDEGARAGFDRALALTERPGEFITRLERAAFELATHRPAEAAGDAARAVTVAREDAGPGTLSSRIGLANLALARALKEQGKTSDAHAAAVAAVEHLEPTLGSQHAAARAARALAGSAGPLR